MEEQKQAGQASPEESCRGGTKQTFHSLSFNLTTKIQDRKCTDTTVNAQ